MAMLQAGEILPTTLVPDLPTQYAGYMPENYDRRYRGAVPAKEALARSLNVPAVRMLRRHGIDKFYAYLTELGMSTLYRSPEDYGLSIILGGAEATLWDLVGMYANLAYVARLDRLPRHATYKNVRLLMKESIETSRLVEFTPGSAWLTLKALEEFLKQQTYGVENRHQLWTPGRMGHWQQ
jgi:penicillin-binding protein 1C